MTVKVTIAAEGREVTVETDADAPVAAVIADALTAWTKARPRHAERPVLQAGGMGFQAELAEGPSFGTDLSGVR